MTTTNSIGAGILIAASFLPLTATAKPPTSIHESEANESIVVIRGSHKAVESGFGQIAKAGQPADAVIVMRPAPGSFMRETSRLQAEDSNRNEQAARDDAREATARLAETMRAIEVAVRSGQPQQENDRHEVFFLAGHESRVSRIPGHRLNPPAAQAPR